MTPGSQSTLAPADPAKSSCFNCSETGYFANACLNPCSMPRINEIKQEDNKILGNNKATKEDKTDSEN
jgi:hypothetical protein